jgi:hypothetical protein
VFVSPERVSDATLTDPRASRSARLRRTAGWTVLTAGLAGAVSLSVAGVPALAQVPAAAVQGLAPVVQVRQAAAPSAAADRAEYLQERLAGATSALTEAEAREALNTAVTRSPAPAAVPARVAPQVSTLASLAQRASSQPSKANSKAYARQAVTSYGWGSADYQCLVKLWTKESQWDHRAMNRSSGAYGIPQSLPGGKMASAGKNWRSDPPTQIRWGLGYIKSRYGSPCAAWRHSQATNWY